MTFNFTHADTAVLSSAVDEVYYNADKQELVVVLDSGHGYLYDGVPYEIYEEVSEGRSPGRTYATVVKRNYGPGVGLGYVDEDDFEKVQVESLVDAFHEAKGTPKGLTLSSNAVVDGQAVINMDATGNYINLAGSEPVAPKADLDRTHVVHFNVEDGNEVKTYSVKTDTVGAAVDALAEVANTLGVNVNVKGVYVHFE